MSTEFLGPVLPQRQCPKCPAKMIYVYGSTANEPEYFWCPKCDHEEEIEVKV